MSDSTRHPSCASDPSDRSFLEQLAIGTGAATKEENNVLVDLYQNGTPLQKRKAAADLVRKNMPLILKFTKGYYRAWPTYRDDIIQLASIGLLDAAEKFDASTGYSFSTLAIPNILKDVRRIDAYAAFVRLPNRAFNYRRLMKKAEADGWVEHRDGWPGLQAWMAAYGTKESLSMTEQSYEILINSPRVTWYDQHSVGLDGKDEGDAFIDQLVNGSTDGHHNDSYRKLDADAADLNIDRMLTILAPRERQIIEMRFGLGEHDAHTLEEVGDKLGVTRERIRQLQAAAVKSLQKFVEKHGMSVGDFLPA